MEERFSRLRGFQDILGEDEEIFSEIEEVFRKTAKLYGFKEIRLPILEKTELFVRSIGEATDIVSKEMFTFQDKGGRNVTMRPEGTASVVRAFLENNLHQNPSYHKLFYIGPMFRAERPQAGRLRQFHQAGVEWFGLDDPIVDFETISFVMYVLEKLGIKDHSELAINSVGCKECVPNYKEKLKVYVKANIQNFCDTCKERFDRNVLRLFDCKVTSCQEALRSAPKITDNLCQTCKKHFDNLSDLLSKFNIPFTIDTHLVRGLDYYTRNVFEIRVKELGAQNAICGGGRYNNLVEEFGGPYTPAFGFAMGIERTTLAIKKFTNKSKKKRVLSVCVISEDEIEYGIKISNLLREKGITTYFLGGYGKISKQMKIANSLGSDEVVIIGEDEIRNNTITLKKMNTGEQIKLNIEDIDKLSKLV